MICDDSNNMINPGVSELCDGLDNDCNGMIDDGLALNTYFLDSDNDGYGDLAVFVDTCLLVPPAGFVWNDMDCDDNNNMVNPGVVEICDEVDNECNGMVDDGLPLFTYYADDDGDGFGNDLMPLDACNLVPPEGFVDNNLDCDDTNEDINPDAIEVNGDGEDNNCDGYIDDAVFD